MSRSIRYVFPGLLIAAMLLVLPLVAQRGAPAASDSQWLSYSASNRSTGYSPADLINRDNVKNLQIAWSWKFDNFGNTNTEVTPIMVNGILYFPLSPHRTIVAADAGTVSFDAVSEPAAAAFVGAESLGDSTNAALRHWYRYNFLTHLLEPNGHLYVIRDRSGAMWRVQVLSYYCPGPTAGCLTIRYAPVPASG